MSNEKKKYDPNVVMLGGRLTKDPELKYNNEEKPYTVIRIANNQGERTNFISIPIWGNQAENVCRYLKKGRYVMVEGKLISYDKEKGENRETVILVGLPRVYFMPDSGGGRKSVDDDFAPPADETSNSSGDDEYNIDITEDDIPF